MTSTALMAVCFYSAAFSLLHLSGSWRGRQGSSTPTPTGKGNSSFLTDGDGVPLLHI
uniref:Uncharacterized protein n=1 Tax=Setaria viridis TaxID=4556 RepID=A0A4V6DDG4_SETVI|nr:hypothetical protein SEVIR_1G334233v2 [Setaria viridis]